MNADDKHGKPWQDDELDVIINDYFSMLSSEINQESYVKSKHSAILMKQLGRTHRSVEFKHQNISAVLDELGLPWIPGYIPKPNYQNAIFDAIDRYLTSHPQFLITSNHPQSLTNKPSAVFVNPPTQIKRARPLPDRFNRLITKFDPVERDKRNRSLGKAGESFVVNIERNRLTELNRTDLAKKIRWVSHEDGDGAGYDILSYNIQGQERLIEVKTTNGSARTPFFLSRNEYEVSIERANNWCIYRVHMFIRQPQIFTIYPPLQDCLNLKPESWRASF
jgi:hypothetical protein